MNSNLYLLKITLKGCHVKIWRKFAVPADIKLDKLHQVIQTVMGWTDSHLHEFKIGGAHFGVPDPDDDWGEEVIAEKKCRLDRMLAPGFKQFQYVYDFGDDWEHVIKVESLDYRNESGRTIFCFDGQGACPPEDVGSTPGYADFCDAVNNPSHPEHKSMKEWVYDCCGYPKDKTWPDGFDIDAVNQKLAAYENKPKSGTSLKNTSAKKKTAPKKHYVWMPPK